MMRATIDRIRQVFASSHFAMAAGIFACAGIVVYVLWYASAGQFSTLFPIDNAHIDLGEAFLGGQVSLLEQPSTELNALQDPYDPAQRIVPFLWDASYYKGQYYLYWGPVPALAFGAIEGITRVRPSGSLLVILCYIGLAIILSIILYQIQRFFFPSVPGFSVGLGTLMGLMSLPFVFLLGRPGVYETSVISGQFFLFLGLLSWVMYIVSTGEVRWLMMAGLSWGLAIGSRYNLAISIAIYLAFALTQIVRDANRQEMQRRIAYLLVPLTLCLIGLGTYNFARFGNPLETGITYQLSIPEDQDGRYSPSYILSNQLIYLFFPLSTTGTFPFITFPSLSLSPLDEIVAGLIPSTPGVWLLVLAVPSFIRARIAKNPLEDINPRRSLSAFLSMIMVSVLAQFLFLTSYYFTAMRYLADFYLPLALGIWILVWQADESIQHIRSLRALFWLVITMLVLWTTGIGFFGSFDVPPQILRISEPIFYTQVASYWNHWYSEMHSLLNKLGLL